MEVLGPARSLRRRVGGSFIALTTLALLAGGLLIGALELLGASADHLAAAVESVRISEEAEIQLLVHSRAHNRELRGHVAGELLSLLAQARAHVASSAEATALDEADRAVAAYLAAPDPAVADSENEAALSALRRFARFNVADARATQARAARTVVVADRIASATAALLLLATVAVLWWLRTHALRPMAAVADAMVRFQRGERDVRADERGAAELSHMARSFNQLAAELTRQRDAQYSYFAGVAHDLRNPLNVMKLSLSRLTRARPLPPEETLRPTLERVSQSVNRLERMVADILDAAQIETGILKLAPQPGDLRHVVEQVCAAFHQVSDQHTIRCEIPAQAVAGTFDPMRVEQVLTNLVSNAIKYSPQGGEVAVSLRAEADRAVLAVTDRGVGMSPKEMEKLFEPFRRVGVSKESIPGVGLGLFVVKRIVEAHGGAVRVDSKPGEGSRFEVKLPLGSARGGASGPAPADHQHQAQPEPGDGRAARSPEE